MAYVVHEPWPLELFQHAKRLRAQGVKWAAIAERLGKDRQTLEVQYSKWKHGKLGKHWESRTRIGRWIELAESGTSVGQIARDFGVSVQLVCVTLARHGYDGEVRSMYRDIPLVRRAA